MARDLSKYNIEGIGKNLNKRQLVYTVIKDFVDKNNPNYDDLKLAFPDHLQGGKNGVICNLSDSYDPTRFDLKKPITLKDNVIVIVSNQWGKNITQFISAAETLEYRINLNVLPIDQPSAVSKFQQHNNSLKLNNFKLEIPFPKEIDKIIICVANKPELIYENLGERIVLHYDVHNNAIKKHNNNESEPIFEFLDVYEAAIPDTYEDLNLWMGEMSFSGEAENREWSLSNHGGFIYDKINVSNELEEALKINFNEKNMYMLINEILVLIDR
jgi:hypothetical protein